MFRKLVTVVRNCFALGLGLVSLSLCILKYVIVFFPLYADFTSVMSELGPTLCLFLVLELTVMLSYTLLRLLTVEVL